MLTVNLSVPLLTGCDEFRSGFLRRYMGNLLTDLPAWIQRRPRKSVFHPRPSTRFIPYTNSDAHGSREWLEEEMSWWNISWCSLLHFFLACFANTQLIFLRLGFGILGLFFPLLTTTALQTSRLHGICVLVFSCSVASIQHKSSSLDNQRNHFSWWDTKDPGRWGIYDTFLLHTI